MIIDFHDETERLIWAAAFGGVYAAQAQQWLTLLVYGEPSASIAERAADRAVLGYRQTQRDAARKAVGA